MSLQKSHVFSGFSVDNLVKAKEFYSEVLGITIEESPMGINLQFGGENHTFVYEKHDHLPATFTVLNFQVENIDSEIDELTAKGVVFEVYPDLPAKQDEKGVLRGRAANMGPDIAWFKDPSGNIFSLLQE